MTKYYLEVIKKNLSFELDSDIHYFYHFEIGDIICIEFDGKKSTLKYIQHKSGIMKINYDNPYFKSNWDKVGGNSRLYIKDAIDSGYLIDTTLQKIRNEKIKSLGI